MTYLKLSHLVADSDPSKSGPTALVRAFSHSRSSPVKTGVICSHPQQTHSPLSDEFLVLCIFYHNLLYFIFFFI